MKLVLLTAVADFKKDIKEILRKSEVKSYSYKDVIGFKNASADAMGSNWFGTEMTENESVFFYAFVPHEKVDFLFTLCNAFNAQQDTQSHIHVAVINIEQSN